MSYLPLQAFFGDCQNPAKVKPVNVSPFCSRDELLAGGAKLVQLVKYHLLPGSIEAKKGNTYFKNGNKVGAWSGVECDRVHASQTADRLLVPLPVLSLTHHPPTHPPLPLQQFLKSKTFEGTIVRVR